MFYEKKKYQIELEFFYLIYELKNQKYLTCSLKNENFNPTFKYEGIVLLFFCMIIMIHP